MPFTSKHLNNVHPDLQKVVVRASELTDMPFRLTEGLRSAERQKALVAAGKSKTLNSRHLSGCAVDVVAMVDGVMDWNMPSYFVIAKAFAQASDELNIPIRWGGCWKWIRPDMDFKKEMSAYVADCREKGKRPLLDGVHFELPASERYP